MPWALPLSKVRSSFGWPLAPVTLSRLMNSLERARYGHRGLAAIGRAEAAFDRVGLEGGLADTAIGRDLDLVPSSGAPATSARRPASRHQGPGPWTWLKALPSVAIQAASADSANRDAIVGLGRHIVLAAESRDQRRQTGNSKRERRAALGGHDVEQRLGLTRQRIAGGAEDTGGGVLEGR